MTNMAGAIKKAASAVKIEISAAEEITLETDLKLFLDWLTPLLTVDAGAVEPVITGHAQENVLREDNAVENTGQPFTETAILFDEGYYRVPPIIE